jgi:hypothetical protein
MFNCNWLATRWQLFSTHIRTNNTGNVTKQTIHRTTQKYIKQHKKYIEKHNNSEQCGPCPVFAGFTLAFALQLGKKHGKTSVKKWNDWIVKGYCQIILKNLYIFLRYLGIFSWRTCNNWILFLVLWCCLYYIPRYSVYL